MGNDPGPVRWSVRVKSVLGASHKRANLPNQDAFGPDPLPEDGKCMMLIVSDGHGSLGYFRSDRGARLAVQAAQTVLESFLRLDIKEQTKRMAEEQFPRKIVYTWQNLVREDLQAHPVLTPEEAERLGLEKPEKLEESDLHPYGATLLAVLVTETYIVYLQLGDGDILTVSKGKGASSPPLERDGRLIGNETTSLCSPEAWNDLQVHFQPLASPDRAPALILLATDGYKNAFSSAAGFEKAGEDFLELLCTEGPQYVEDNLEHWLNEATELGSGDDITVGLLYRLDVIEEDKSTQTGKALGGGAAPVDISAMKTVLYEDQTLLAIPAVPSIIVSQTGDGHYRTITEALSKAKEGAVIHIRPGIYRENIVLDKDKEHVTLQKEGVGEVIIESRGSSCIRSRIKMGRIEGITLRTQAVPGVKTLNTVDIEDGEIELKDCDISAEAGSGIAIHGHKAKPTIKGCSIHDARDFGICIFHGAGGTIEDCQIFQSGNAGIIITSDGNPTVRGCEIRDGKTMGVYFYYQSKGRVENTVISGNATSGVGIVIDSSPVLSHCTIQKNGGWAIYFYQGTKVPGRTEVVKCNLRFNEQGAWSIFDPRFILNEHNEE
jgi:parallel beta-helix repeat protein